MAQNLLLPKEMKFIIPDRIELGIHQKSSVPVSKRVFQSLKLKGQSHTVGQITVYRVLGQKTKNPTKVKIIHSRDKKGFLLSNLYLNTNGIVLCRQRYGLKEPKRLSCDGKKNYLLESHYRPVPDREKVLPLDFTLYHLPEILWDLFQQGWRLLSQHLMGEVKEQIRYRVWNPQIEVFPDG